MKRSIRRGGTTKLPRQIDPNDFVTHARKCSLKAFEQHELNESELVHHELMAPATET